ncbi:DUF1254 domain-containing protein [Catelliglobosispora koreensis]|uniref:DUF1254 domain-containing protein n=1 Tax=Catelliglobosispora koreensis TaxID=129052 RepID=UPI00036BC34F|nr:DUF1254 domain-containing protein [Catelliglobosispora koreensis]
MGKLADDLATLSREAYIYLYPLVTMDITRGQGTGLAAGVRPGFGPPNQFNHMRTFPPAEERSVVRINFDTLYSVAWLDLTRGPLKLHVPDTADRYYLLPMLDMWTDVFATVGKRSTGTSETEYVITGPGFTGELPPGHAVIQAPTPYVWIIARTQTNGPADYAAVNAIQDGFTLTPLGVPVEHIPGPDVDVATEALVQVNRMSGVEFFTRAAKVLMNNPPHPTDFAILARIAGMGIIPGKPFDPPSPQNAAAIDAGAKDALAAMQQALPGLGSKTNGWTIFNSTIGVYGNSYLQRAVVTLIGLGANPPEDAVYPILDADADGEPLTGEHDYVLHFDADRLPPVDAFWSVTMYDAQGFQIPNAINRFALGDRDPLTYNPDGSLDLYLRSTSPGPDRESNWLPAGPGPLGVTMRLYAPRPEVINGGWTPPPVRKA